MKFENYYLFEILQLTSLFAGVFGLVPQIEQAFVKKSQATENLSIITTGIFVFETMIRLPNIGKGLFSAIQTKNSSELKRLIMVVVGIFAVGLSFYLLLIAIARYNTDRTEKTRRDKHIAQILAVVYGFLILGIVIYFIQGIAKSL